MLYAYHCEGDWGGQPLHCHEEVEFVAVCRGRGVMQYGRSRHDTGPGVLSVIGPHEPHAGTPAAEAFAVKGFNVALEWFEAAGVDWRLLWQKGAHCTNSHALAALQQTYQALVNPAAPLAQDEALLNLCSLLHNPFPTPNVIENKRVEQARGLLRERFAEPLSLTELADSVGLTPVYLCRVFRQATGISPHAYQVSLRVAHAKTLLERGLPSHDVAREVGFYDQSHLTLHFKRLLGVTPARIAKRVISSYTPLPASE